VPEHEQTPEETPQDEATPYEAPQVDDLDTVDGPAVTAAGKTKIG
jgi:hypothetical protein